MMSPDLFIYLNSIFFFVMGTVALVNPVQVTRYFGLHHLPAAMRNEVRAVYGGFGVAIAVLLVIASRQPMLRDGVVIAVAVALGGMAGGRLIGFAIERSCQTFPVIFLGVELGLAASLMAAI